MDTAVGLVKCYLEFCGYFVLAELPVRVEDRSGYHDVTDLDIIAVRFPHTRRKLSDYAARPLEVFLGLDPVLASFEDGVDVMIAEVKEGRARLNPALRRTETVEFALRRVGCCPDGQVAEEARAIVRAGQREMTMPGRTRCRVRLVVFAGRGEVGQRGVHTVPLAHCTEFIANRLREAGEILAGVQFKDAVLGLFALQAKLAREAGGAPVVSSPAGDGAGHAPACEPPEWAVDLLCGSARRKA